MDRLTHNNVEQLESGLPDEKLITLKSIYKTGALTLMPAKNLDNGRLMGIQRLSENQKLDLDVWADEKSKVRIEDGHEFDLNDPEDALTWAWVKHNSRIALSYEEAQKTPSAIFYVYIPGVEAAKKVSKYELRFKAMDYVMNDPTKNHASRARLTGISMEGEQPDVIKEYLFSKCDNDPQVIINAYENASLSLKLLLFSGLDKGIIQKDINEVYTYKTTVLGVGELAAISFLQEPSNRVLAEGLSKEINPEYFKD